MRRSTTVGPHAANGDFIRRHRRRKGLTQTQLGISAGIGIRQMIRLENGEHLPSRPVRDRLAEALDVERTSIRTASDEDEEAALPPDLDQALRVLARYTGRAATAGSTA